MEKENSHANKLTSDTEKKKKEKEMPGTVDSPSRRYISNGQMNGKHNSDDEEDTEAALSKLFGLLCDAEDRAASYKFELDECQQCLHKEQERRSEVQTALEMMSCELEMVRAAKEEAEETAYKAAESASASAISRSICLDTLSYEISILHDELAQHKLINALRSGRLDDARAEAEHYENRCLQLEYELGVVLKSLEV
jgi:hypothetical protein